MIQLLIQIARLGGLLEEVKVSNISNMIEDTLQNSALTLQTAQEKGLIQFSVNRNCVKITNEGHLLLEKTFQDLSSIFANLGEKKDMSGFFEKVSIEGVVESGLAEAARYIAMEPYSKRFQTLLGYIPFPGTLNIRIKSKEAKEAWNKILSSIPKIIPEFDYGDKHYGTVSIWAAIIIEPKSLNPPSIAIIRPFRTHYIDDILEVISPTCLRVELGLKDGMKVQFNVLVPVR